VLEALGAGWTRLPDLPDEAYVLEWADTLLVCPWNLRLRVARRRLNARDGVPSVLADAFVPPVLAGQARAIVEDWRSGAKVLEHGVPRVHEQVATWGVPLRWFVFVDLEERDIELADGRRTLRYRTEISKARRRAHRAVLGAAQVARRRPDHRGGRGGHALAGGVPPPVHRRARLRLAWSNLLPEDVLEEDDSPGLVAAGLSALSRGGRRAASETYEKFGRSVARCAAPRALLTELRKTGTDRQISQPERALPRRTLFVI